jgi:uncharacterized protein (TIGR02145 family)
VSGVVRDQQNMPVANARVIGVFGGEETITDINGFFRLNNIIAYDKVGSVNILKRGFFDGSRSFLPVNNGSNFLTVQLIRTFQSGTFLSSQGGQITAGTLNFTFSPNSIEKDGQPYNGTVLLYSSAIDPTNLDHIDKMPGNLLGGQNDSLFLLKSFGMAAVELRSPEGELLQLMEGSPATIKFTIPATLYSDAPNEIDFWSYDQNFGVWKHEGIALKEGALYTAQATHFSWWNIDSPYISMVEFRGTVVTSTNQPIAGARVEAYSSSNGQITFYTNELGEFGFLAVANSFAELTTSLTCNVNDAWVIMDTLTINFQNEDVDTQIVVDLIERVEVFGTAISCSGNPVSEGYILVNGTVYPIVNGDFSFFHCVNSAIEITVFDNSNPDSLSSGAANEFLITETNFNIGELSACEILYSNISDIEGNIYATVQIGSQWWMASNLNTSKFSNGDDIPIVFDDDEWMTTNSAAYTYYNNNFANASDGKLYNGLVAINSTSVCPVGWRMPTNSDWIQLADFLGGSEIAGGKLKSQVLWYSPIAGTTNESGFSALPSGYRSDVGNATYFEAGTQAFYWSSSAFDSSNQWYFYLNNITNGIFEANSNVRKGFSIRCIKE